MARHGRTCLQGSAQLAEMGVRTKGEAPQTYIIGERTGGRLTYIDTKKKEKDKKNVDQCVQTKRRSREEEKSVKTRRAKHQRRDISPLKRSYWCHHMTTDFLALRTVRAMPRRSLLALGMCLRRAIALMCV